MIFPDGTKKEGYFENNVYKVKVKISKDPSQPSIEEGEQYQPLQKYPPQGIHTEDAHGRQKEKSIAQNDI